MADCFSPLERAVLAYTDAIALQHGRVPDGVFQVLHDELSEVAILELTYITGTYVMHAITTRALRLEFDEQQQQITGVTALLGESAVQLQAFAAPRTEGVWVEIRDEIAASIGEAGGTAEVVTREFGEELQTRMPQPGSDGRTVFMPARFVGIDGPRWFLRAVISGRAAVDPAAAEPITELIATTVVNRGDEAMPPRELLPLTLPDQGESEQAGPEEADGAVGTLDDLRPFERGPEITEVR